MSKEVQAGKAVVEVSIRDRVGKGLVAIERRLSNFGSSISGIGAKVAGLGAGMTTAFGALAATMAAPLSLAGDLESVHASFKTMLGSGEAATAMMDRLRKLAADTPLEFSDIADAAKKLIAFGVASKDVEAELRRVGDIASGIGAPIGEIAEIYGKAKVQGRLFAEDINQLTGRGIPIIQELAKQFGVTETEVKGLVESGKVNFGHLQRAFIDLTSSGGMFAGAMAAQAKTLKGTWSTLKDNLISAIMPIGNAVAEIAKPVMGALSGILEPIAKAIAANSGLAKVIAGIAAAGIAAGAAITVFGIALVAAGSVVSALSTIFGGIAAIVSAVGAPVILPIAAAIAAVVLAITAGAAVFGYVAYQSGLAGEAIKWLSGVFGSLSATVSQTFGGITAALAGGNVWGAAEILWAGLKVIFYKGVQAALSGFSYLWNNAYAIAGRFAMSLGQMLYNVFAALPRLLWAALKGGASVAEIIAGAISGGMDLGKIVDEPLAKAQAELDALNKKYAAQRASQQQAQQAAAPPPQQPPMPGQVPPGARPPLTPQQMLGGPTAADVERMQREHFLRENAAAYARAGRPMPMDPSQMRAPGELQSPAERLAAANAPSAAERATTHKKDM
ncbi:MAG: tape measure protein [Aureliella sp.]